MAVKRGGIDVPLHRYHHEQGNTDYGLEAAQLINTCKVKAALKLTPSMSKLLQ
mgnify:FL=1